MCLEPKTQVYDLDLVASLGLLVQIADEGAGGSFKCEEMSLFVILDLMACRFGV